MTRVGRALCLAELRERTRDRWVLVISILFALLASAVSLYGRSASSAAGSLTGPSLVTLASLFVPLVALALGYDAIVGERERNTLGLLLSLPVSRSEVVLAKFVGRGLALTIAVLVGLGAAMLLAGEGESQTLASLIGPTLLLGWAFVSIGMLVSTVAPRQSIATSLVVVLWFLLVFFYDLGLLGLLVATDGEIPQGTVQALVLANPAGLYRLQLVESLSGTQALSDLGLTSSLPGWQTVGLLWTAWILGPLSLSALVLSRGKAFR
ncbi:MAG: ABC transporter permease [Sandaracinaceae bacterium]|nr:ABC transporter permease [Sandaracinaceae bacterium]